MALRTGRPWRLTLLVICLLGAVSWLPAPVGASEQIAQLRAALRKAEAAPCQPWSVPPTERCAYVIEHRASCYPDGGWQTYIRLHYCVFAAAWQWLSLLVLAGGSALAFAVLLTVSERFFCPALELISDYLRLPPAVAGATLLSFGNGAPDIFTQVAAVGQGGSAALSMALAEPLGGGIFASNIVFGCVVLAASRSAAVVIQRWAFLKDVGFYLASLLVIVALLADRKVVLWEAGVMLLLYAAYVAATFWVSRHDEPVHADIALHEVVPEQGVDVPDSCSESDFGSADEREFADAATSICRGDLEAGLQCAGGGSLVLEGSELLPKGGPRLGRSSSRRRSAQGEGLLQPLLDADESGQQQAAVAAATQAMMAATALPPPQRAGAPGGGANGCLHASHDESPFEQQQRRLQAQQQPQPRPAASPPAQRRVSIDVPPSAAAEPGQRHALVQDEPALPPVAPAARQLRRFRTFSEGVREAGTQADAGAASQLPGQQLLLGAGPPLGWRSPRSECGAGSPRCAAWDGMLSPSFSRRGSGGGGLSPRLGSTGPAALAQLGALQAAHEAEQRALLEQQYEEQLALLEEHESKATGPSLKHRLQRPLMLVLSCTMPRVGTGHGHHYPRWRAALLPLTAPLTLFVAAPRLLAAIGGPGLAYGGACAGLGAALVWASYPATNVPRGTLKGVFAVMTFFQAIMWLNISASALVQLCVILGVIFGVSPALLGATVLAWGNSVPDLINNVAMARDGFPSMAVAACFASPLFTLLVGLGSALAYGVTLSHGRLDVPVDGPLLVMVAFGMANSVKYLTLVPLAFKYRMTPVMAVGAFAFYATYNVVYGLTVAGVLHIHA